jgi:hypothetical protein
VIDRRKGGEKVQPISTHKSERFFEKIKRKGGKMKHTRGGFKSPSLNFKILIVLRCMDIWRRGKSLQSQRQNQA